MTAEGDNSVLMQKVAKEHLALFKPHKLQSITSVDLNNPEHIVHLLKLKENEQYNYLRNKIGKAMVFTKVCSLKDFERNVELLAVIFARPYFRSRRLFRPCWMGLRSRCMSEESSTCGCLRSKTTFRYTKKKLKVFTLRSKIWS